MPGWGLAGCDAAGYDSRVSVALGYLVKPLMLIALFGTARLAAMGLKRVLPPGKLKRVLFHDAGPL